MIRFIIYLWPALMDMVVGSFLFISPIRLLEQGASAKGVAAVITAWAIAYIVGSVGAGRLLKHFRPARLLMISGLMIAGCCVAASLAADARLMYGIICVQALGCALFFAPFQVFMKDLEGDSHAGVVRSTALYTVSWSLGLAMGPFLSGYLWDAYGYAVCFYLDGVAALAMSVGVGALSWWAKKTGGEASAETDETPSAEIIDYDRLGDYAWVGWVICGAGCLAINLILAVFPLTARDEALSRTTQGVILGTIHAARGLFAILFIFGRRWMYRPVPLGAFGVAGILGMLLFATGGSALTFGAGALCLGVFTAAFFYYVVFHCLVHPQRSARYVATNEAVVGGAGAVGPLLGGMVVEWAVAARPVVEGVAQQRVGSAAPYFLGAVIVLVAVIVQVVAHRRGEETPT